MVAVTLRRGAAGVSLPPADEIREQQRFRSIELPISVKERAGAPPDAHPTHLPMASTTYTSDNELTRFLPQPAVDQTCLLFAASALSHQDGLLRRYGDQSQIY